MNPLAFNIWTQNIHLFGCRFAQAFYVIRGQKPLLLLLRTRLLLWRDGVLMLDGCTHLCP